jgi:serine/threonine protein kinase
MPDLVDQIVGSYRIDVLIGAGGMAQVYRAIHVELNRIVAIKVMWPNLAADPAFQERFLREAQAASALSHPNIVAIHDFSRRETDGLLYLVMEFMTQGSLRDLFNRRLAGTQPLELVSSLDLVRQAADGLAYAHGQHMIHRDIKPDNLLLDPMTVRSKVGCPYTLKVADFGLAKISEEGATVSSITAGTAAYMSPEQCQGETLDARTDLYSLGVVLYEIATGYPPFQIKTIADAVYKHVNVEPIAPLQVNPDLPPRLQEIILRCLAKKRDDRYATAEELSVALTTIIEEIIAPAPPRDAQPKTAAAPSDPGHIYAAFSVGEKLQLTPDVPATAKILIVNFRKIVDHFHVTVEGIPADWVKGNESELQLNPNGHGEMTLTITAPRAPANTAGEYPVVVRAQSRVNPADTGAVAGTWTLLPYYRGTVAFESDRPSGIGSVLFRVILRNTGNTAVDYRLAAEDNEPIEITYHFTRTQIRLDPGTDAHVDLEVSAPLREGGDTRRLTFQVIATPDAGDAPQPAIGTWFEQASPPKAPPVVPMAPPPEPVPAATPAPPAPAPPIDYRPYNEIPLPAAAATWPLPAQPPARPVIERQFALPPIHDPIPPMPRLPVSQSVWATPITTGVAEKKRPGTRHGDVRRRSSRIAAIAFAAVQITLAVLFFRVSTHWPVLLIFALFHVLMAISFLVRQRPSAVIYLVYSIAFLVLSAIVFLNAARSQDFATFFFDHHLVIQHRVERLFVGDPDSRAFSRISYQHYAAFLLLLVVANVLTLRTIRRVRR